MSERSRNEKKIEASNIRIANTIRARRAEKEKPDEKVAEYFRSIPYHLRKRGENNEQSQKSKESDAEGKATGNEQY